MKKALYIFLSIAQLGHAMSLHDACRQGDVPAVERILQEDANQINEKQNGCFPIHFAAYGASSGVVKLLLDTKPELIDEPDERGNVPFNHIFIAILDWQKEEARLERFVQEGYLSAISDWFASAKPGTMKRFKEVIELFIKRGANVDRLNHYEAGWQCLDKIPLADYARCLILIKEEESDGK